MNLYERIINILMESFLNEGLMRRQRVAAAMNRKLQGNQSQVNPDDPNLQEPGANTPQGKEVYTPSERQSANARVAQSHRGAASAEARRGERIRSRIVQGGAGLRRMAAGAQRGNPFSPEQKAANKEVGGVAKTSPMDVLRRSRELQARSQQQGDNASNVARGIRHQAANVAREKRGLPAKSRYSSRAPVGEQLPESTMNVYERILNILLETRVDMFIQDRLDEAKVDDKLSPADKETVRNKRAEYPLQGGGTRVPDTETRVAMNKPVPKSPAMKKLIRQTKGGISPVENPAKSMKRKVDPEGLRLRLKQHSVKDKPKPQIP